MFENAKINGFFVRLYTPGDGVVSLNIDPANQVRLDPVKKSAANTFRSYGGKVPCCGSLVAPYGTRYEV